MKLSLAHIINPVKVDDLSDLYIAQPITFESMRRAKVFATDLVDIELYTTNYPEDELVVQSGFIKLPNLKQSVLNYGKFKVSRKLPLIRDILDRLYEESNADYFIFTNVDIGLQKEFYTEIAKKINEGYDAFVINRRTITNNYTTVEDLDEIYMQKGLAHPGYDCFIFKRDLYRDFLLGNACLGANWIGRVILSNLVAFGNNFKVFKNLFLTFHIGDDRSWKVKKFMDYDKFNESELITTIEYLNQLEYINNKKIIHDLLLQHKLGLQAVDLTKTENSEIPANINKLNTPELKLPDINQYFINEFRHSMTWEKYKDQKLLQNPIFIVGYPRSGTTLLQALLATQKGIVTFPETHFFDMVRPKFEIKDGIATNECIKPVIEGLRDRVAFSKNAEKHLLNLALEKGVSAKMVFEILIVDMLLQKNISATSSFRWVEKTPDHVMYLDIIKKFYPDAKIIYIMRDPEKAIVSRKKYFTWNNEISWPIKTHAEKWLESIKSFEKFHRSFPKNSMLIKLEDLVKNKEKEMKNICDFTDLAFDSKLLNKHKEIAKTLYYPWETWKNNASNEVSKKISSSTDKKLPIEDRIKLIKVAGRKMLKYGYLINTLKN